MGSRSLMSSHGYVTLRASRDSRARRHVTDRHVLLCVILMSRDDTWERLGQSRDSEMCKPNSVVAERISFSKPSDDAAPSFLFLEGTDPGHRSG